MERFRYIDGVSTLELHEDICVGCGICETVCPHSVFALGSSKARIVDRDLCMECGACARNCPTDAVTVQAGVGCAAAVINAALGRDASSCCCVIEPDESAGSGVKDSNGSARTGCC